jgi:hypothetical protein
VLSCVSDVIHSYSLISISVVMCTPWGRRCLVTCRPRPEGTRFLVMARQPTMPKAVSSLQSVQRLYIPDNKGACASGGNIKLQQKAWAENNNVLRIMGETLWFSTFHQLVLKTQSDIHVVSMLSSGIFGLYFYYQHVSIKWNDFNKWRQTIA